MNDRFLIRECSIDDDAYVTLRVVDIERDIIIDYQIHVANDTKIEIVNDDIEFHRHAMTREQFDNMKG